jgi:hypothetical protein
MRALREVTVTWAGEPRRITVTNRLLMRIEREGDLSLLQMAQDFGNGKIRLSFLAFVLAAMLGSAVPRVKVTEDELLDALMGMGEADVGGLTSQVFAAIFPAPDPKKPVVPEETGTATPTGT